MKLLSFQPTATAPVRSGVISTSGLILDLLLGYEQMLIARDGLTSEKAKQSAQTLFEGDLLGLLNRGQTALEAAADMLEWFDSDQSRTAEYGLYVPTDILFAPVIPAPVKVVATGWNYSDHIDETRDIARAEIPQNPTGFMKLRSALVGHQQPVVLPSGVQHIDYEIEMAIVIGQQAYRVSEESALDYVAGYTIMNDVSARDLQLREMNAGLLLGGKNYNTFGPLGPYLTTKDEIPDPQALDLALMVNGEIRQKASTATMVWTCAKLVSYWSSLFPLEIGDVISTGTPPGVALGYPPEVAEQYYLQDGDVMEASIEGLGTLVNPVVAERP